MGDWVVWVKVKTDFHTRPVWADGYKHVHNVYCQPVWSKKASWLYSAHICLPALLSAVRVRDELISIDCHEYKALLVCRPLKRAHTIERCVGNTKTFATRRKHCDETRLHP